MRRLLAAAPLGVLAALAGCGPFGGAEATPVTPPTTGAVQPNAIVEHIVDGDTIDVVLDDGAAERVRLIGIDTPEIDHPASGTRSAQQAECYGPEASDYTESLVPVGTRVRLERDTVPRDDYGRMLAYVYRASDGIFLNFEIIRHGYAQPLTIPPNDTFGELMVGASRDAERDDAGLWAACSA